MSVRAKFKLNSFTTELATMGYESGEDGKPDYKKPILEEKRTLNMTPVMASDASPENRAFWQASPSGSLQLGVVNKAAWDHFELGREYYVDFTPAN
jgi:hypothetical protein